MAQPTEGSKKDAITQRIENGFRWAVKHYQQVALAATAIVVIGLLTVYVLINLRKLQVLAWEQLSSAQALAAQGNRDKALEAVNQLISTNRHAPLATQAQLFKGDILLLQGKTEDATKSYDEALRQAPTPELKALALANLALAYEQAKNWKRAEELYRQFIKDFPEHFLTARSYEAIGRILMVQQNWTEAQSTLERLVTLYPTTLWARNAQEYLAQIKAQLPKTPPKP